MAPVSTVPAVPTTRNGVKPCVAIGARWPAPAPPDRFGAGCPRLGSARSASLPRPAKSKRLDGCSHARRSRHRRSASEPLAATPCAAHVGAQRASRAISTAEQVGHRRAGDEKAAGSCGKVEQLRIHWVTWCSTSSGIWSRPPSIGVQPARPAFPPACPTAVPPPCTQPIKPGWALRAAKGRIEAHELCVNLRQWRGRRWEGLAEIARELRPGITCQTGNSRMFSMYPSMSSSIRCACSRKPVQSSGSRVRSNRDAPSAFAVATGVLISAVPYDVPIPPFPARRARSDDWSG